MEPTVGIREELPPIGPGLYLHIPFCERKCVYCDFYSIEKVEQTGMFLSALHSEIDLIADRYPTTPEFATVFLGGGTPSLLSPRQMDDVMNHLHRRFHISSTAEITAECNPGTVDVAKLSAYRTSGINRISFGVQSFNQDELDFLGRIHNADQARSAVRAARDAGFDNLSIDLIFALPMHTQERWEHTLREAVALEPEHISAYSLIYEEGTPLYAQKEKGLVTPLDEDIDADLYLFTIEFLAQHGYRQYEVSNYARAGGWVKDDVMQTPNPQPPIPIFASKHNLNYWRRGEYLSFGPSAHSFWEGERRWNVSSLTSYLETLSTGALPVAGSERLTRQQVLAEVISLGLRSDGIRLWQFRDLFNFDFLGRNRAPLDAFVSAGLLLIDQHTVRCTPKGYLSCDALALELLNDCE